MFTLICSLLLFLIIVVVFVAASESASGGWVEVAAGGCQVADAGVVVRHGETWWSEDRCTECHCKNGALECQNSHCASCLNPHYLPGHCCPVCHGESSGRGPLVFGARCMSIKVHVRQLLAMHD